MSFIKNTGVVKLTKLTIRYSAEVINGRYGLRPSANFCFCSSIECDCMYCRSILIYNYYNK